MLERRVAGIAHAAVHLHGAIGGLADKSVAPVVAHRHLVGDGPLDLLVLHAVHLPGRLADQEAQHLALGLQLDQRPLDGLVLGQRLAEGLALAGVFDAFVDTELRGAQR